MSCPSAFPTLLLLLILFTVPLLLYFHVSIPSSVDMYCGFKTSYLNHSNKQTFSMDIFFVCYTLPTSLNSHYLPFSLHHFSSGCSSKLSSLAEKIFQAMNPTSSTWRRHIPPPLLLPHQHPLSLPWPPLP